MKSVFLLTKERRAEARGSLCLLLLVALSLVSVSYGQVADDPFKARFLESLKSITLSVDGVVGVAIKDLRSGQEFLINGDEIFPQASSIKIHILSEVFRQAEQGKFRMMDIMPVPPAARVGGSGVLNELGPGSVSMSIRDYAILMIVLSDNTATNLLIQLVGMDNINRSLESMGATKTKLQRVMMDLKAATEGRENIGTPREVMVILDKMYRGELVGKKASEEMISILRKPKEGPIKAGLPESIEVAGKDGEVEAVRCDVGIVFLPDSPYIICVMTKLLSRDEDGSRVITDVSRLTFQYLERLTNSNQYGRRVRR
jgi:beta-lactamase class A